MFYNGGWTVLPCKGGMPYDDIGYINVYYRIMSINRNGTCSISGQVKRLFCYKQKDHSVCPQKVAE